MSLFFKDLVVCSEKVDGLIHRLLDLKHSPEILYGASRHLIDAGGKRIRPFLVLKSCEIVGGQEEDAIPVAVALELIHNFTLIHDDIMDMDAKRRGTSTVHVLWGNPVAITAGDLLFAKAYEAILHYIDTNRVSLDVVLRTLAVVTEASITICEGQALDLFFEQLNRVSEDNYFDMVEKKTASLIEASAKSGAIIGGGTLSQVKRLGDFARYAGLAFQLVDDALGLVANEKVLGKPVGSDIREGKKTLIMVHALEHADRKQRKLILSTLGNKEATFDDIDNTIKIMQSIGSIDYATKKAEQFIVKSKAQLSTFPESQAKDSLFGLSDYIITRRH